MFQLHLSALGCEPLVNGALADIVGHRCLEARHPEFSVLAGVNLRVLWSGLAPCLGHDSKQFYPLGFGKLNHVLTQEKHPRLRCTSSEGYVFNHHKMDVNLPLVLSELCTTGGAAIIEYSEFSAIRATRTSAALPIIAGENHFVAAPTTFPASWSLEEGHFTALWAHFTSHFSSLSGTYIHIYTYI
mgnify:FL=1